MFTIKIRYIHMILILTVIFVNKGFTQRHHAEMILYNNSGDSCGFDATGAGHRMWDTDDDGFSFFVTTEYEDVDDIGVDTDESGMYGWDWRGDSNPGPYGEFGNGFYKIWLTTNTSKYIFIDYRDDGYDDGWGIGCPDIEIHYDGPDWRVRESGGTFHDVTNHDTIGVWTLFSEDHSIGKLHVPIVVQTNYDDLDSVMIGGVTYESPCYDTSYTADQAFTIEAPSPQYGQGGYQYSFNNWSDGGARSHSVSIESLDSDTSWTANYNSKVIPVPGLFNIGVQDDHPYLTWITVTGDSMDGYYIHRNYDREGWVLAATINTPSTSSWSDNVVEYDPGGDPVSYRMCTKDYKDDISDWTNGKGIKGFLLIKKPKPYIEAVISPEAFSLKSNVPNPFNPTTSIGYSLAVRSDVTLSIYNVLGKKIRTLVHEEKSMGDHTCIWDGKDDYGKPVSAGVYIYAILANPISNEEMKPFRSSGKMLLAK